MTCKELHDYCEGDPRAAFNLLGDSTELSEHVVGCPECNGLLEQEKEVARYLDLVRSSAPAISASLDNAVLGRYRRYASERSRSVVSLPTTRGLSLRGALAWSAALAFAVIVACGGVFLLIPHQRGRVDRDVAEPQSAVVPQVTTAVKKEMAAQEPAREITRTAAASAKQRRRLTSIAEQGAPFPTRFQGLMYCDQLSCAGAMDVIRLQLPSPPLGVTPASARTDGLVFADVLVGPDGIARGIRIVE